MAGSEETVLPAQELRCLNCGAPWELRGFQTTRTVACEYCGSVIDTSGEQWQIAQKVEGAYQTRPRYGLGTRGQLDGVTWEVIGWSKRQVRSYGTIYPWEEHLLYNPYHGFRYLIYQDGHWVVVEPVMGQPHASSRRATYGGRTFKHFSSATAEVAEVLGEFPFQVKRGDQARATDFVDPPRILSKEESEDEEVWSEGRYLTWDEVRAAFGEPQHKPRVRPAGIHPCQPNPDANLAGWFKQALPLSLVLLVFVTLVYWASRPSDNLVWQGSVPKDGIPAVEVDLTKGAGVLELQAQTGVDNQWVAIEAMLVGPLGEDGQPRGEPQARPLALEVSHYHGRDSDGSWSEGSQSGSLDFKGLPKGKYTLQVQPLVSGGPRPYQGVVALKLVRDPFMISYPCCGCVLVLLLPLGILIKYYLFEQRRWQESDHA